MLPHCEGAQTACAEQRGADVGNVVRAISEALPVPVEVGTDRHPVPYPDPTGQGSDNAYKAAWSDCQVINYFHFAVTSRCFVCLVAALYFRIEPGRFSAAWA